MNTNQASNQNKRVRALVESAVLVSLSVILSFISIIHMPFGGSVTLLSMLPIVIISYKYGLKWSILSGLVFSIVQSFLGGSTIMAAFLPGEDQMIWYKAILMVVIDYILAYTVLGLAALTRKMKSTGLALCVGAVIGTSARYLMHIISGVILWGSYAEWFFSEELPEAVSGLSQVSSSILSSFNGLSLSLIYSLIYNGIYMIPEIIFTAVAAYIIGSLKPVQKYLKSEL